MNFKTTLYLLVIAAILLNVAFYMGRNTIPTYEKETDNTPSITDEGRRLFGENELNTQQITGVKIDRGEESLVISRVGNDWFQTEPVRVALNSWKPKQIVDDVIAVRYLERFKPLSPKPSLQEVGLDPPQASITLVLGDNEHTLRLGKRSVGGRSFVMHDDDKFVYVVKDRLQVAILGDSFNDWRKKSFEAPEASRADLVKIRRDEEQIELTKTDGRWFLDLQGTQRASHESVEKLVQSIGSIYIDQFVADAPDDLGLYGLDPPSIEVTLRETTATILETDELDTNQQQTPTEKSPEATETTNDSQPQKSEPTIYTLRIGSPADLTGDKYFSTWSDDNEPSKAVFTIGKVHLDKFEKSADDLRDVRIVLSKPGEIRELNVQRADQPDFTLQRATDRWSFADTQANFNPDFSVVTDLIEELANLEATGFSTDLPKNQPELIASLYATGRTEPERIFFYKAGDVQSQWWVKRDGESIAHLVDQNQLASLVQPLLSLRNRNLPQLEPEHFTRVTLLRDDGDSFIFYPMAELTTQPTITQDGSLPTDATRRTQTVEWGLEGEDSFESGAFGELLGDLKRLRVEEWVPQKVDPQPGWIDLTIEAAAAPPQTLQVDPNTGTAILTDTDLPFVLPLSFINRLTAEYRNRTVLNFTRQMIESIRIQREDESIMLRQNEDGVYSTDDAESIDEQAAASIFDALAGLQVQRFLIGPPAASSIALAVIITTTKGQVYDLDLVDLADTKGSTAILFGPRSTEAPRSSDPQSTFRISYDVVEKLLSPLTINQDGEE